MSMSPRTSKCESHWNHVLFSSEREDGDWIIECTGKGANYKDYLADEDDYPKSITIFSVYVKVCTAIHDTKEEGPWNGKKYISTSLFVTHNCPWQICNDESIEAALSERLGFKVSFGEQGAQKDGLSFMSSKEWSVFADEDEDGYDEMRRKTNADGEEGRF